MGVGARRADAGRALLRSPLAVIGGAVVVCLVLVGALAPVLAPFDPRALSGDALQAPSAQHLLGTNDIGQDLASQLIWGARSSLALAIGAASVAVGLGLVVGVGAGLAGGMVDTVVMRGADVVLALPRLPLLVLIGALAGAGRVTLILVIGLLSWPVIARLVRAQSLSLRQRGFIASARGFGGSFAYVGRRHLVPALGPLLIAGWLAVAANAVLTEAALSFLGLSDPTAVSWGLIVNKAVNHAGLYFTSAWAWWLLPAGGAITLAVGGFALLGVGLEPVLNPRWARANRP